MLHFKPRSHEGTIHDSEGFSPKRKLGSGDLTCYGLELILKINISESETAQAAARAQTGSCRPQKIFGMRKHLLTLCLEKPRENFEAI